MKLKLATYTASPYFRWKVTAKLSRFTVKFNSNLRFQIKFKLRFPRSALQLKFKSNS